MARIFPYLIDSSIWPNPSLIFFKIIKILKVIQNSHILIFSVFFPKKTSAKFPFQKSGLPQNSGGSAPTLPFSRPAQRSFLSRPVYSPGRHATLFTGGFEDFVASTFTPIATGWSDLCRVGISPTVDSCLFTAH
jgi:hypothetical protein